MACGACRAVCPSPGNCQLCGKCITACPRGLVRFAGDEWESDALARRILRLKSILQAGGGVTFSGGEVLLQPDFLCEMLDKTAELHRAVETCGFASETDFSRMLDRVDLVYFDLKVMDGARFGGGCVNDTIIHLATSAMPFGGVGGSGMGGYHGKAVFDTFTHWKSIVDKKTWMDLPMRYQPYKKLNEKLIRLFLK